MSIPAALQVYFVLCNTFYTLSETLMKNFTYNKKNPINHSRDRQINTIRPNFNKTEKAFNNLVIN